MAGDRHIPSIVGIPNTEVEVSKILLNIARVRRLDDGKPLRLTAHGLLLNREGALVRMKNECWRHSSIGSASATLRAGPVFSILLNHYLPQLNSEPCVFCLRTLSRSMLDMMASV